MTKEEQGQLDLAESMVQTSEHIFNVQKFINQMVYNLMARGLSHDRSKLTNEFERNGFAEFTKKLADMTYGSEEYKDALDKMAPFIENHYAENRHHPEHFATGINEMTLVDLLEMICDWSAASLRHKDGNILRSIELNQSRFGYSDELKNIFMNTAMSLEGLIDVEKDIPNLNHIRYDFPDGHLAFYNEMTNLVDDAFEIAQDDIDKAVMLVPNIYKDGFSTVVLIPQKNDYHKTIHIMHVIFDKNGIVSGINVVEPTFPNDRLPEVAKFIGYRMGVFNLEAANV